MTIDCSIHDRRKDGTYAKHAWLGVMLSKDSARIGLWRWLVCIDINKPAEQAPTYPTY